MHRGREMLRKFAEGLVFGAGFAIAFFVLGYLGTSAMFSMHPPSGWSAYPGAPTSTTQHFDEKEAKPFYELPIEDQIKQASVIAVARYEAAEDGRMKAVLKELLKKDEGTAFHYQIGDEYAPSSYYPKEGTSYGDGIVIFFEGSPARMTRSMSYSGERIISLGDMPLELFRDKCKREGA
jgi:hypothetical protein